MKHRLVKWIKKHNFPAENTFSPKKEPGKTRMEEGILYNDIAYGKQYPNSYLDIYRSGGGGEGHPLLIYVHGGGFTWGSKEDGDPNAGKRENGDKHWFFKRFLKEGYDVVSVEYAFAPEYLYPTPLLQLQQAVGFLDTHGAEYEICTKRLILCGSSAGGHIVGQYAAIQTNSAYAEEMGMEQIVKPGQIQCVLFNSALIDPTRYDVVHSTAFNYLLRKCGQAYFGDRVMKQSAGAKQANILSWVTEDYPVSFISEANTGSFYDQAGDLYQALCAHSVKAELNLYPRSEVRLSHGYESFQDKYGLDNMEKMLLFLRSVLGEEECGNE